ncbi:MAG: hypothetical protein C4567_01560 [Deltaproteobacteria bacterium]|nr:MAG: hypothetical protein C4567_01560 [Deltaproteobacteria bacterium]
MPKNFGGMPLREYVALVYRLSKVSLRARRLAEGLEVSESYIHKLEEGERIPNLQQWLETIQITGDLDGVKRLVRDLGGVVVWKNGSLAGALRELAEELELEERQAKSLPPPAQVRFPGGET